MPQELGLAGSEQLPQFGRLEGQQAPLLLIGLSAGQHRSLLQVVPVGHDPLPQQVVPAGMQLLLQQVLPLSQYPVPQQVTPLGAQVPLQHCCELLQQALPHLLVQLVLPPPEPTHHFATASAAAAQLQLAAQG